MSNLTAEMHERLGTLTPPWSAQEQAVEWAFRLSLMGKALLALFQTIFGIALWISPDGSFPAIADFLTRNELIEDPTDPLARTIMQWASTLNVEQTHFYVLYLLGHGLLHLAVVLCLLLKWRIAYPISLATLSLFVIYQAWRFLVLPDPMLIVLTAIDIVVIVIVVLEHRQSTTRKSAT